MKTRAKVIELVRENKNVDRNALITQLERMARTGIGNTLHKQGWNYNKPELVEEDDKIIAKVKIFKKQKRERDNSDEVFEKQFTEVLERISVYGTQGAWSFADESLNRQTVANQCFDFDLPTNVLSYFTHIYDREAQIRIIHSSISAAKSSVFEQRNHCLLWGKPGCGKTETALAFEKMLGSENVFKLDATATTKAGAENLILNLDPIPPILIIEELEKCNPANLPWLLGILDQRGEIIKTTARVGSLKKQAKCLCIATANDLQELTSIMSGALASRFQHKIYFPRPTRMVIEKILLREVKKVNGDVAWIDPILDYVLGVEEINDPRRAIALLDGREKWLTGEYVADLINIQESMNRDKVHV